MAINLVSLVQQFLTPQMVSSLARAVGVNEAVAQKLVAAALPAILAALATAAVGRYGERAMRAVDPALRERYFDRQGDGSYLVGERLRRLEALAGYRR